MKKRKMSNTSDEMTKGNFHGKIVKRLTETREKNGYMETAAPFRLNKPKHGSMDRLY